MTIAETLILILVASILYALMRPLQRRLEARFYNFFRSHSRHKVRPVIDITGYAKKDKPKS